MQPSLEWPEEADTRARLEDILLAASRGAAPYVAEWQGTAYRLAGRDYADRDRFTDGMGALRSGGRFTPPGTRPTLYLSLDLATTVAELASWNAHFAMPAAGFRPRVLAAVGVSVGLLLDLCNPDALAELRVTPAHVGEEWRPAFAAGRIAGVQTFGRLVHDAGFEVIRFPSARQPGGINLALFPENYREGSHAIMLNAD